ncbi:MAG: EamA family transporter [Pseudomonadota bacterium]
MGAMASMSLFVGGAAGLYTLAMILMKLWTGHAGPALALGIAFAFALGAFLETAALRDGRLGLVYCLILGVESVLVVGCAHWLFGEVFTAREWIGGALVIAGVAVVSS